RRGSTASSPTRRKLTLGLGRCITHDKANAAVPHGLPLLKWSVRFSTASAESRHPLGLICAISARLPLLRPDDKGHQKSLLSFRSRRQDGHDGAANPCGVSIGRLLACGAATKGDNRPTQFFAS